jgi:hypothetical protein
MKNPKQEELTMCEIMLLSSTALKTNNPLVSLDYFISVCLKCIEKDKATESLITNIKKAKELKQLLYMFCYFSSIKQDSQNEKTNS